MDTKPAYSQIDVIVYLASLASDPRAIDEYLDTLRQVTARLRPGEAERLNAGDTEALRKVRSDIEHYLVEREPLRSFTTESLHDQVYDHFEGQKTIGRLRWSMAVIGALTVGLVLYSFLSPHVSDLFTRTLSAVASLFAIPSLGAIWFFLSASKGFKPQLRTAYRYVAGGIAFFCLFPVHLAVVGLWVGQISQGGHRSVLTPVIILSAIGLILVYVGVRRFAKIVQVSSWLTRWYLVAAGGLASGLGVVALHRLLNIPAPEWSGNPQFFAFTLVAFLGIVAAILSWKVAAVISPLYQKALRWFAFAQVAATFFGLEFTLLFLVMPQASQTTGLALLVLPFSALAVLLLKSGYAFNRTLR
ncbi:MAG TPA: hypothetical protein VJ836_04100 [Candidatus Saccharimonadales bacterium]|nr:hypothetical protein [Candidatus Saccharimonadales bacterium]